MPRFPIKEAEVAALAEPLWRGLQLNSVIYPNPPVNLMALRIKSLAYKNKLETSLAKKACAEAATTAKDEALEDLIEALKSNIRYAENTVNYDDNKLKLIGWAGRKTATALTPPGHRLLEAPNQSEGWVFLDWKAPADGGVPAAYKVMRRERPAGAWEEVATAVISEATLVEQPRSKELEYRIVAVNKSGDGEPSNTVMVVL
ncbi:MAG: fibronectin type III domain-containing protein [Planctomycetes bacterium]|nr:fibronectin type III domain-containing protein [Planctomycetota bacterium]MBU2458575.1 fibronectin type III domain-containing protein [Planctomycetota bacterium]MBU2596045.1 fibronectin type III domain-containing protein [Planctomycetota bacterium]